MFYDYILQYGDSKGCIMSYILKNQNDEMIKSTAENFMKKHSLPISHIVSISKIEK